MKKLAVYVLSALALDFSIIDIVGQPDKVKVIIHYDDKLTDELIMDNRPFTAADREFLMSIVRKRRSENGSR
jgi:hypothetical protein